MKNISSDDVKHLIEIFDQSEWRELALQVDDLRVFLSRDPNSTGAPWQKSAIANASTPTPVAKAVPPVQAAAQTADTLKSPQVNADDPAPGSGLIVIRAPNLGIFYRSPKPGAAPYVELGERVEQDTEICLIEVMKLFTPVISGVKGILRKVCVEDGEMVEFDQPLFHIEPESD